VPNDVGGDDDDDLLSAIIFSFPSAANEILS
jgi:hypothetical protein